MMKDICNEEAQNRVCTLELNHDGHHEDSTGFKFIDDEWPNYLGNGPSGYPMNNPAFEAAVKRVLDAREEDEKRAREFLRKMRKSLNKNVKR